MTTLADRLGLSDELAFYDVWSLDDASLLAHIPRPALALLVIIPLTPAWEATRRAEDSASGPYQGQGDSEPVIWFKQTIGHACGSIGLLHCAVNGPAARFIRPGSDLDTIRRKAIPLGVAERAEMLYNNEEFEKAHQSAGTLGDTAPPSLNAADRMGQHFVAFVKADDGHLWELEGSRQGPLDRGKLGEDEDVLSQRALDLGMGRIIRHEQEAGGTDLRFSCIALARRTT